jgi:hypothetical protein
LAGSDELPNLERSLILFQQIAAGGCQPGQIEHVIACDRDQDRADGRLPNAANEQGMVTVYGQGDVHGFS